MKTAERDMARRLRREDGLAITDIARRLGVAKSSVSLWVRDIELTEEERRRLRSGRSCVNASATNSALWRHKRRCYQEEGRAQARRGEASHAAGCMLYWAEGSKNVNAAQLTNADPEVLRFFAAFLRTYFDVPDEKFRVWCNLFADHAARREEVEDHWLGVMDLPRTCLGKATVNVYSRNSQRKRINMLPYGTCRLSVHSVAVVQHIYGAIQEYGGFDRPEWLG